MGAPVNPSGGNFGVLSAPSVTPFQGVVRQTTGRFNDGYTFTIAQESNVHVTIDSFDNGPILGVFGIRRIGADIPGVGAVGSGQDFTVSGLAPGEYSLTVQGVVTSFGIFGFGYEGTLAVSQVPLPAAAWLFGSAVAGLVFLRRKRSGRA
ncbi:MAG: VPLPA-CTERM sorting domain-containing protein [Pseudomonadota bacterium]